MTATEGPVLPQELLDLIIDYLNDDLEALRSCALVSSNFLQYSRVHLFSHIRVGPLDKDDLPVGPLGGEHNMYTLEKLFRHSPYIAARVKSLHLWDNIMRRHSWIEAETQLNPHPVAVLSPLLVSLTRLCITIESGLVHWANISAPLRASIRATRTLPTLTCVELTGIYGLPFTLLSHCPALRTLTLNSVSFDQRDSHDFASTLAKCAGSPSTRLEHLNLQLDSRMLELLARWILLPESPLDITRLRSFTCVCDNPSDNAILQRLLNAASPALQSLRLENVTRTLNLASLLHLHTLTFDVDLSLEIRVLWLTGHVVFPYAPHAQPITLVLQVAVFTANPAEELELAVADRHALTTLPPCVAGVTIILAPMAAQELGRKEKLVDVSSVCVPMMPLLQERLARGGRGVLKVLKYESVPDI